jgi:predicted DsbA family dithiol-disulfide isomerase
MSSAAPILFFDYVDPLCYLLEAELAEVLPELGTVEVTRVPSEVCPPPAPLVDPDGPWWTARWTMAEHIAGERGRTLVEPRILPWTRKAHELVLHARQHGMDAQVHAAIFQAIFGRGDDIGRVDVLVELAGTVGLNRQEAKVVLDVDRYGDEVATLAARTTEAGVGDLPALVGASGTLQGFHNRDALRTFLLR